MPIYYAPPQPVQASPHVPIGNQGDPPPKRTLHGFYAARGLWSEPAWPAQYGPRIVAQTLTYGDQPPSRTNAQLYQIRATWAEPAWPAQSEPANAAFNLAITNQPPASQLARIYNLRGLWPEPSWPAQSAPSIAPQTLVYGDQPPRLAPLQPAWPQPAWNAQSAAPNAAWNVPVATSVPPNPAQWHIWQAWQSPPQPFQRAIALVQPSTGDQPPPHSIYLQMAMRNQWPEFNWPAQSEGQNAGWNYAPASVDNPPPLPQVPWQIWASWNIPPQPQQLVQLQVVDNPPPPEPSPSASGSSGGGGSIDYQSHKRHKPHLRKQIDEILDSAEAAYRALIKGPDPEQAVKLVKPFAESKRTAVPPPETIDWKAVERDVTRTRRLIALATKLKAQREIDDDDEEFMLLH